MASEHKPYFSVSTGVWILWALPPNEEAMSKFAQMGLNAHIQKSIKDEGYEDPTPIQSLAIPPLLEGRDLLGIAQTGTGKTAAFSLPIVERMFRAKTKAKPLHIRALILAPTRELASQINDSIRAYSRGLNLFSGVIFGGVGKRGQINMMQRGCDVLVATPGRLVDLLSEGHIKFDQVEYFVLDEADRMLDLGFIRDIQKIIRKLPKKRQTMLFSATMPKGIAELANSLLERPKRIEVTPESTTVEKIDQKINMVEKANKIKRLVSIFDGPEVKSALVFSRTKYGADRIARELEKREIKTAAIHGNKSQGARERALKAFKDGSVRALVATDIAARGIDIDRVGHVINFDLPEDAESYVHRIGRTARAGRSGVSVSFCDVAEVGLLRNIEKFIRYRIPVDEDQEFHTNYTSDQINLARGLKKEQARKRQQKKTSTNKSKRQSSFTKSGNASKKRKAQKAIREKRS